MKPQSPDGRWQAVAKNVKIGVLPKEIA